MSREACVNLLNKSIQDEPLARQVEKSIAEHAAGDEKQYKDEVRSKAANLKTNPELLNAVKSGQLPAARVAELTPEQMATPEKRAENEAIREEELNKTLAVDTLQPHTLQQDELDEDVGIMHNTGQDGLEFDAPNSGA
ncbi:hypothetical protein BCR37DRAFT_375616 [Protomyces lactucae-debilis]|uniref:TFIIS central domain-containing protein n=1 Tax=Protomyces lactucae-debilis TaxID=2754530 RepID=A0A1Y2FX29_PROLT|nr:uncharacterized protein BCR37DRAFT_375616 [Protomyces lactucae-debilis]ORY87736.1 hypothetical protein BCR37DRAFT_375616 [Protomyces lactucae-debilis]